MCGHECVDGACETAAASTIQLGVREVKVIKGHEGRRIECDRSEKAEVLRF